MKNVKAAIKLFRYNLLYTVLFECFLKTVSFAVLIPLYYVFVNYAVKLSGISYLSKETAKKFFKAPSTYAFLFVMFLFIATVPHLPGLIHSISSCPLKKVSLKDTFKIRQKRGCVKRAV